MSPIHCRVFARSVSIFGSPENLAVDRLSPECAALLNGDEWGWLCVVPGGLEWRSSDRMPALAESLAPRRDLVGGATVQLAPLSRVPLGLATKMTDPDGGERSRAGLSRKGLAVLRRCPTGGLHACEVLLTMVRRALKTIRRETLESARGEVRYRR